MQILMLTPYFYPVIGGTERVIESMSIKLNEKGVPTDILTINFNQAIKPLWKGTTENINMVKVKKVPALENLLCERIFQIKYIPGTFLNLLKDYDILHFHNDADLTFPFFSYLTDKPKIFHFHCLDVTYDLYRRNFVKRFILKHISELYVVLSSYTLRLLTDLGFPKEKIRIVPNGIDTKIFRPGEGEKEENLILFVGRVVPKKGLHVLLKALCYLTTPVRLIIVGPLTNPEYSNNILALIESLNKKTVHKITYAGVQRIEELIKLYQKATVLICPSLSEPFPMVNLEALSCGTPVVASNVGGIPDVVQDHFNGILVPPSDEPKLAEAIQYLLDNENIRRNFGRNGRIFIKKNFSSDVMADKLCQIYREIIN